MDAAQVARNVARGKGYTTYFIRPFSMHLVQERNEKKFGPTTKEQQADRARVNDMHPDLANAPGYPFVIAALMKVLPFYYDIDIKNRFWSVSSFGSSGQFWRYEPDFLISFFNQVLFLGVVALTFFLARKLFDRSVAWTTAILLLGCEQLWNFCVSGLSTMLVLLIFMGVVWCLVLIEEAVRENRGGEQRLLLLALATGLLMGLGTLSRYSFGWLIVPVLAFLILSGGKRRTALCLATFGMFVVLLSPWLYRNWSLSGAPFGTATYAILEGTGEFEGNRLARSLAPSFDGISIWALIFKFLNNSRQLIQNDLPKLGGNWAVSFFLVGLMMAFRSMAIRRLRYFVMGALAVLFVVQALGRTHLSDDSPDFNTENLLVLLVPLVIVYGVSLFYLLLDNLNFVIPQLRLATIGLFGLVVCLPMIYSFLLPRPTPLVFPPYHPPSIREVSQWMEGKELMMSDVPWAVAWYGERQCVWLTLNSEADFHAINNGIKKVQGLYLTPLTLKDGNSLPQRWQDDRVMATLKRIEGSWGWFVAEFYVNHQVPENFPLHIGADGFLPEQLFITDRERWKKQSPTAK